MGLLVAGKNPSALKSADRTVFTATAGQTTFAVTQGYQVGDIDVFLNGLKLNDTEDYLATNGSTIVLTSPANAGDSLAIVGYNQFLISSSYTKSESDNRYLPIAGGTNATSYIRTPNYGISSYSDSASASLEASAGLGEQGVGVKAFGRSVATNGGDVLYTSDSRGAGGRHRFGYWNGTSFTNTMTIDSLGRVAKPGNPSFRAYSNSTGNYTTVAGGVIPFPNVWHNIGGHYNTSTYRFTAPISGSYMFCWAGFNNGSTNERINIRLNGSASIGQGARNGSTNDWEQTVIFYMNANEYVDVRSIYGQGTLYLAAAHTEFAGAFLG